MGFVQSLAGLVRRSGTRIIQPLVMRFSTDTGVIRPFLGCINHVGHRRDQFAP